MKLLNHYRIPFLGVAIGATLLEIASSAVITAPGDAVVGVRLEGESIFISSDYPEQESPDLAFDGDIETKYLNFEKINTGVIVTPTIFLPVTGFELLAGNDAPERDPTSFSIWGTNVIGSTSFSDYTAILLNQAINGFGPDRFESSGIVPINNNTSYVSYLIIFPTVADSFEANSMQVSEIRLLSSPVPEPSSLVLVGCGIAAAAFRRGRRD